MLLAVSLVSSILCVSSSIEPHCSKFHYEEKLLEKMVRMEIRMEEIETKLKTCEDKEEKLDEILEQVLSSSDVPAQPKSMVSFSARAVFKQYGVAKGQTLLFESVLTNLGSGYSPSSGRFVAPVGGTYFFYCSVISGNSAEIWLYIAVNDSTKARFYARGTDGRHDMGSQALVVALNKADVVSVHNSENGGNIFGHMYSTFSGFLLR